MRWGQGALRRTANAAFGLCAVVLATATAPETATAQPRPAESEADRVTVQARERFERAVSDYDAGRYEVALAGFQEAYRLKPHPLVRVNMANCYDKLGRPVEAMFHFERFLEGDVGTPLQRKEVAAAIVRLKSRVGEVRLQVAPDGAVVIVDEGEQRRAPVLDPIVLAAGTHRLEVRLEGYRTQHRSFDVAGGTRSELAITLERLDAPAAVAAAPPPAPSTAPVPPASAALTITPAPVEPAEPPAAAPAPPLVQEGAVVDARAIEPLSEAEYATDPAFAPNTEPARGLPSGAWIAGGVTVAFLISGSVSGVFALRADDEADDLRAQIAEEPTPVRRVLAYNSARSAIERAQAWALASDILFGGALLGAAVTTYLVVRHSSGDREVALTPLLGPEHAGLSLRAHY